MVNYRYPVWLERETTPDLARLITSEIEIVGWGMPPNPSERFAQTEAVLAGSFRYGDSLFAQAPSLLAICRTGIGYDGVDLEAASRRGIAVCNTPDGPTVSTAEHTWGLILATTKQIMQSSKRLRQGMDNLFLEHKAVELDGKTLGLVGFGRIARRVADMGAAFGLTTVAYDPYLTNRDFPPPVRRIETLATLLAASDIVCLHLPSTPHTRGMFDSQAFAAMKPGAVFVNTSRGTIVDHQALLEALEDGHLFGVGLDVTDPEPLPADHPLLHHPDVVVTPHIASSTPEGRARMFKAALDQAVMVMNGQRPPNLVNTNAWDHIRARWGAIRG